MRICALFAWVATGIMASAAPLQVMTFEPTTPASSLTAPYIENGILLTAFTGTYSLINLPAGRGHAGILDFSSPAVPSVRFSLSEGTPFELISLTFPGDANAGFLSSSAGGFMPIAGGGTLSFRGSQWTGISYISLSRSPESTLTFDNITLAPTAAVPEPSTLLLITLTVVFLSLRRI